MVASKRVVITGVSRGLGLAMTRKFIELGHVVAGCCRSETALEQLSLEFGTPHEFGLVDVSNPNEVDAWAQRILANGPPDLLINNAALINANAVNWQVPNEEFSRLMDVNIKGVFYVTKAFLPTMIERGIGVVVNFSSGWGRSAAPDVGPYCATKWAIEGMTRSLAAELPSGLAAIPLNPGIINTEMLKSCFGDDAGQFPSADSWANTAVPFLLNLGPSDNGQPLTAP